MCVYIYLHQAEDNLFVSPCAKIYVQKLLFTYLQMNEYEDVIKALWMETKIHDNHSSGSLETNIFIIE